MRTMTIHNPETNRMNKMRVWDIDTRALLDKWFASERGLAAIKDISWNLMGDDQAYQAMKETEYGDSADSNFALSAFENALDIRLGMAALTYLDACREKYGRRPKTFGLAVTRTGDIFILQPGRNAGVLHVIPWDTDRTAAENKKRREAQEG